jgi:hypothetical protein
MVTRKPGFAKQEHRLSLHIQVSRLASLARIVPVQPASRFAIAAVRMNRRTWGHHIKGPFPPHRFATNKIALRRIVARPAIAATRDEPGAMAALIGLKLSDNAQFQDRPGGCKLIETAANAAIR